MCIGGGSLLLLYGSVDGNRRVPCPSSCSSMDPHLCVRVRPSISIYMNNSRTMRSQIGYDYGYLAHLCIGALGWNTHSHTSMDL